jgi:hypothetical protein
MADFDVLLAASGEFRPVARDRDAEIEFTVVGYYQRGEAHSKRVTDAKCDRN